MSNYSVNTPGFLDLPNASKQVKRQAGEQAKQQTSASASDPTSKLSSRASKRAPSKARAPQLSLRGFDPELHTRLKMHAAATDVPMVRLVEQFVEDGLERGV